MKSDKKIILGTQNFNIIQTVCNDAMKNSKLIGIIGNTGYGKTIGLMDYANKNENVYYLKVRKSHSPKSFHLDMLEVVGDKNMDYNYLLTMIINQIVSILKNKNKNSLIIIDEAGKLKPKMLEFIHELRDLTETSTGIILAGPPNLFDNMMKWKAKNITGIAEIERRIYYWQELFSPTPNEIKQICIINGLKNEEVINTWIKKIENFGNLFKEIEKYKLYLKNKDQNKNQDNNLIEDIKKKQNSKKSPDQNKKQSEDNDVDNDKK